MSVTLTEEEFRALANIVKVYASANQEDVIGAFMLTGGFRVISEEQIVELSSKINSTDLILPKS